MNEKKFDKQKLLTVSVTVLLVFFFIGGFLLGLDRVQSMEGTFPPNITVEGLTPAPENEAEAADYFLYVLNKTNENTSAVTKDVYFEIDKSTIVTDGSDTLNATINFAAASFIKHISTVEENEDVAESVNFGGKVSTVLEVCNVTDYIVTDFKCSYIYYSCPSCGEQSDILLPSCEKCGSSREYFKKYRDEYDVEFMIRNASPAALYPVDCEGFTIRNNDEISALTDGVFDGAININSTDITYNGFRVNYKVNRLTDEITYLCYTKLMSVSADVSFIGKYEALGSKNISFDIAEKHAFTFTWPGISLDNDTLVIEPESSDNLLATLTCENPSETEIIWTSSDESVAVVDDEGYIDAKNEGEAVITASFSYLGNVYSDTCSVFVRVPVEAMKMSDKKITLTMGESFTLSAKVSPSSATVRTVKWYSENEKIAKVDNDGTVTAVSAGKVIIYALSDDGYYRSTCEVTVE